MYLENQYFSSSVVGAALAARLREPDGPEIVVVSRRTEEGWLEERTMGVLRARLHKQLAGGRRRRPLSPATTPTCRASRRRICSTCTARCSSSTTSSCSVGSANFSNRSMGFDTECNVAIEARGDERIRRVIAGLRNRLLAEHLGTEPADGGR